MGHAIATDIYHTSQTIGNMSFIPASTESYQSHTQTLLIVFNIILGVVTLIGNMILLCYVCGHKKARTSHNVTLVNIAVAAIVVSLIVIPTEVRRVLHDNQPNDEVG